MNLQQFGVISLTLAATVYLIIQVKKQFPNKGGCEKGCNSNCGPACNENKR